MKNKIPYLIITIILITSFFTSCNSTSLFDDSYSDSKIIVHYIDIKQGDSILIQVNNKNMLIDSGPHSSKNIFFEYLDKLNIKTLDYVILTHPHSDHIGNMADLIKKYNIVNFYAPKVESSSKAFGNMIDALKNKNLKINALKAGIDSIDLGKNTKVTVFSPGKSKYENMNNYSPIIKIEYKDNSFLFTGDAEKEVEKEVLSKNFNLQSDVLKLGHHGSSSSTTENFLKSVNPSIAIISVGKDNDYNHPSQEKLELLKKYKLKLYRTDIDSNIILVSDGTNIKRVKINE